MNSDPKELLTKESLRIEEDALHSMKGHYNAADFQSQLHLMLGLPAAIIAAITGGSAFGEQVAITSGLAFFTAMLIGAMTFLKPSEKSEQHKSSATRYHSLHNNVRRYREITIQMTDNFDALKNTLEDFGNRVNELNEVCPPIPRAAYEKAKKDIDEGKAKYLVDEANNDD